MQKKEIYYSHRKRCTLLVPESMISSLKDLVVYHKGASVVLSLLLAKYIKNRNSIKINHSFGSTIQYQEKGQKLHRVDFRPVEWDWIELKLLASSCNMSICAFFVFLLGLFFAGDLEIKYGFDVVPPNPGKISYHQSITRYSIPVFKRLLHFRL